jgi:protein-L-isoaspartate(D-aspartate) O-methyltransferase
MPVLSSGLLAVVLLAADPYAAARDEMIETQIAARGVRSTAVLEALRKVPRHVFVPESMRAFAYADTPLPIGNGQTISQPYIVAFMTELLGVGANDRVLEIGTGSGYQAAVLARLARQVYTIERDGALAERARATLAGEKIRNVEVRTGDGYKGWPEQAPFDRVIVTAAPPEVPQALVDQLKPGGRLVAPVGASTADQQLVVLEKDKAGRISRRSVLPVRFVPMVPGLEPRTK